MKEGVYSRGNHRAPDHRQENDDPIESSSLSAGPQGRRRASNFLILCLILCFLIWYVSRMLWSPLPISIEKPVHQAVTREIVFELFRYYRNPQARNRTFGAANPVHRRRRSLQLDDDGSDSLGRHFTESPTQDMFGDDKLEEQSSDGQGVEVSPLLQFDRSLKKRMACGENSQKNYHGLEEAPSNHKDLGQWPLLGGKRETDLDIEAFYIKVQIGYGTDLKEYFMHIDTGSGLTWVMCTGRGPITAVGSNGFFKPKRESFMDCRTKKLCLEFQEGIKQPCHSKNHYKCPFFHEYGDGLDVRGHVIMGDVSFKSSDGSQSHVHIAFGCADKVDDEATREDGKKTQLTDGLMGLGPHQASWLSQLNLLGLIPDNVVAICFEQAVEDKRPKPSPSLPESAGFFAFGNSFFSQTASIVWTSNIPGTSEDGEPVSDMYTARLMAVKYRSRIITLEESKKRKRNAHTVQGVQMGFDTGSDLTYFSKALFDAFVKVVSSVLTSTCLIFQVFPFPICKIMLILSMELA